jgi:hypothetical protein
MAHGKGTPATGIGRAPDRRSRRRPEPTSGPSFTTWRDHPARRARQPARLIEGWGGSRPSRAPRRSGLGGPPQCREGRKGTPVKVMLAAAARATTSRAAAVETFALAGRRLAAVRDYRVTSSTSSRAGPAPNTVVNAQQTPLAGNRARAAHRRGEHRWVHGDAAKTPRGGWRRRVDRRRVDRTAEQVSRRRGATSGELFCRRELREAVAREHDS